MPINSTKNEKFERNAKTMGMAASQARLLTLTSRLADNELKSQTINNAKMRLSAESSRASENYINALNDANMMFSNYDMYGTANSQLLNFNALSMYSSYNNQYGLVNSAGQLLVSEEEAALFKAAGGNVKAYLKSHDLEYSTTYFDDLTMDVDSGYPEEFQNLSTEELKSIYEQYSAILNSSENSDYEKYVTKFVKSEENIKNAAPTIVSSILTDSSKTFGGKKLTYTPASSDGTEASYKLADITAMILRGRFSSSNSDLRRLMESVGYTNFEDMNNVKDEIIGTNHIGKVLDLEKSDDGNYTINLDDFPGYNIEIDSSGVVKKIFDTENKEVTSIPNVEEKYTITDEENNSVNVTETTSTNIAIGATLNGKWIKTSTDDGPEVGEKNEYFMINTDDNNNVKNVVKYGEITAADLESELNGYLNGLLEINDSTFSYAKLLEYLQNEDLIKKENDLGKTTVGSKSIYDIYTECVEAQKDYIKFIESGIGDDLSNSIILSMLKDGTIGYGDLLDFDKVLKIVAGSYPTNTGQPIEYTEEFATLAKLHIIDGMIDYFGEPNYTWIDKTDVNNSTNPEAKAQWYTNLFERMSKGYVTLENGLASSTDWIKYALESGLVTMEQVDKENKWASMDYKTCSNIKDESITNDAVAKAEAEYNRAMRDIEAKESIFDIQLKNIDTEHNAIEQEYKSVKKALDSNIERTMKFNQSS